MTRCPDEMPQARPGRSWKAGRWRADLLLLLVAAIWGSGFVVCRVAAESLGTFLYNGPRFLLGALVLLPFIGRRMRGLTRREVGGGALAGLMLFGAISSQQAGLHFTTAGKAGFITSLYVILVPLLLAVVWRQWPPWSAWAAALLAVAGLFLLSGVGRLALAPGDGLVLICAGFWALHVIVVGRLAPESDAGRLSVVQYVVCGLLSLPLGLTVDRHTAGGLASAWWTIPYTAVISVALGFTLQVVGQREAPATDAAILLSMEGVFAALSGWLLLRERLNSLQVLGCVLMLMGVLLAQVGGERRPLRTGEG